MKQTYFPRYDILKVSLPFISKIKVEKVWICRGISSEEQDLPVSSVRLSTPVCRFYSHPLVESSFVIRH